MLFRVLYEDDHGSELDRVYVYVPFALFIWVLYKDGPRTELDRVFLYVHLGSIRR